jgi:hypothetical protein
MPKILWAEALNYATWLKNCLPSHATPGKTPYELVNKSKPNLALAHEFGTLVYVHVTTSGKLEAKVEEATFAGVDQESKGYRIWWVGKRKVSIERNVTFPPMGPATVRLIDNPDIGELGIIDAPAAPAVPGTPQSNVQPIKQSPPPTPTTPPRSNIPLPPPAAPRITQVCPATGYYRALHEGEGATSTSIEENQTHWAAATAEVEPMLKEALNGPDGAEWQTAIDYEIGQLEKSGVWRIIDLPPHANIIPSHFVLATKRSADGEKLKLRARLVANGQQQQYGLNYIETFAPTTNMTTICTILTIATHHDWEIHQVDIKSAYLNAALKDTIYMRAPPGYLKTEDFSKVLLLLRSLYGLKQAGFEWSEKLKKFFLDYGYTRSQVDQAVYFRWNAEEHTIITMSVDDMAMTSKRLRDIERFKVELHERFNISDLGELTWLLGLKVE